MNHPILYQKTTAKQLSQHIFETKINGLYYITIDKHNDERGFFSQLVEIPELNKLLPTPFVVKQANYSNSQTNVVRGLHAEGWNKLVTVTHGLAFSALVDIRPQSSTFKQIEYFQLGFGIEEKTAGALFISSGIANSVCALSGPVNYIYMVDKLYLERNTKDDASIDPFDKDLNINWPIDREKMIISQRDKDAISLTKWLDRGSSNT